VGLPLRPMQATFLASLYTTITRWPIELERAVQILKRYSKSSGLDFLKIGKFWIFGILWVTS